MPIVRPATRRHRCFAAWSWPGSAAGKVAEGFMITALIHRCRLSLESGVRSQEPGVEARDLLIPSYQSRLPTPDSHWRNHARLRLASPARAPERSPDRTAGDGGLLRSSGHGL